VALAGLNPFLRTFLGALSEIEKQSPAASVGIPR
jgi:hypothetical protein